jgi:uncharacterized protein (TIGR02594 family)
MSKYLVSLKQINNKKIRKLFHQFSVIEIQKRLNALFDSKLTEDNIFGNITLHTINNLNKAQQKVLIQSFNTPTLEEEQNCPYNYVSVAEEEIGVKEIPGKPSNKRIEQYHKVAGGFGWTDSVPWCASFISFVMVKSGYKLPEYPYRAKSWLKWGKGVDMPCYGSLAIKSRVGGGHIGIVVGITTDGNYLYLLGGNQNDAVNIKKYRISNFIGFRMPEDNCDLDLRYLDGPYSDAGKES